MMIFLYKKRVMENIVASDAAAGVFSGSSLRRKFCETFLEVLWA